MAVTDRRWASRRALSAVRTPQATRKDAECDHEQRQAGWLVDRNRADRVRPSCLVNRDAKTDLGINEAPSVRFRPQGPPTVEIPSIVRDAKQWGKANPCRKEMPDVESTSSYWSSRPQCPQTPHRSRCRSDPYLNASRRNVTALAVPQVPTRTAANRAKAELFVFIGVSRRVEWTAGLDARQMPETPAYVKQQPGT